MLTAHTLYSFDRTFLVSLTALLLFFGFRSEATALERQLRRSLFQILRQGNPASRDEGGIIPVDMGKQPRVLGTGRAQRFGKHGKSRRWSSDDHVAKDPSWHDGDRWAIVGSTFDHETPSAGRLQRQLGNDRVKKNGRRMVQTSTG